LSLLRGLACGFAPGSAFGVGLDSGALAFSGLFSTACAADLLLAALFSTGWLSALGLF